MKHGLDRSSRRFGVPQFDAEKNVVDRLDIGGVGRGRERQHLHIAAMVAQYLQTMLFHGFQMSAARYKCHFVAGSPEARTKYATNSARAHDRDSQFKTSRLLPKI